MTGHPSRCAGCDGSGYQDGPPLWQTVEGKPHRYSTVKPCEYRWFDDDMGWDPGSSDARPPA